LTTFVLHENSVRCYKQCIICGPHRKGVSETACLAYTEQMLFILLPSMYVYIEVQLSAVDWSGNCTWAWLQL